MKLYLYPWSYPMLFHKSLWWGVCVSRRSITHDRCISHSQTGYSFYPTRICMCDNYTKKYCKFSFSILYFLKCAKRIRHKLNKLMKSYPTYNKLQHYLIEYACIWIFLTLICVNWRRTENEEKDYKEKLLVMVCVVVITSHTAIIPWWSNCRKAKLIIWKKYNYLLYKCGVHTLQTRDINNYLAPHLWPFCSWSLDVVLSYILYWYMSVLSRPYYWT